jgi:hypothetical protein
MNDLIVIVMTVAFFGLAVGYVALCNRIIGPDDADPDITDTGDEPVADADIGGDAGDRRAVSGVHA